MVQPLALVLYEKLLPGTQLVNRLQDLGYRVMALTDPEGLVSCAEQEKPMLVFADLRSTQHNISMAINRLRNNQHTFHIPIVAFGGDDPPDLQKTALEAGATLVTGETGIISHLPEFLERALRVE